MSREGNDAGGQERIRRILAQAEAHGGLKHPGGMFRPESPLGQLPLPYAERARLLPPRPGPSGGWEQLKFPWAV